MLWKTKGVSPYTPFTSLNYPVIWNKRRGPWAARQPVTFSCKIPCWIMSTAVPEIPLRLGLDVLAVVSRFRHSFPVPFIFLFCRADHQRHSYRIIQIQSPQLKLSWTTTKIYELSSHYSVSLSLQKNMILYTYKKKKKKKIFIFYPSSQIIR